ncbi:MAG: hypothetical protein AAGF19_10000 [Pseudomonadota bacterium]
MRYLLLALFVGVLGAGLYFVQTVVDPAQTGVATAGGQADLPDLPSATQTAIQSGSIQILQ